MKNDFQKQAFTMAIDSGQIDLNADAVLSDREDETVGSKLPEPVVNAEISGTETLTDHINGKYQAQNHMVCRAGNDEVANVLGEPLCGSHLGGKEGYDQGTKFVDTANAFGAGTEHFNVGCDVKASDFPSGLVKNEDKELITESSNGAQDEYGGTETDEGLITELSDGVANVAEVTKNAPLSIELELNKMAPGDNNMTECGKEDKYANGASSNEEIMQKSLNEKTNRGASSMNLREFVGHESEIKGANDILSKDDLEDCNATGLTDSTCKFQDLILDMEVKDVDARESLPHKDPISWNHLYELETSRGSKQPASDVHKQAEAIQSQTTDTIVEEGPFNNIQNGFPGINLFVDLNSYRNFKSVDAKGKPASSQLNFHVSDLVWGKVRGHPWWPGQIFDPSAASENAKKHLKIDNYLIAYFGDQTFAWNESFKIKPFQTHFSQMKKQSNLENFHHAVDYALDEVSRRVEFGLSCPCIPEEVFEKLKTQVIYNAGIQNHSSRIDGGDRFLNAISFEPKELVNIVKSLANLPFTEFDRLEFVIARAQLLAFYRAKGYPHLPEFTVLDGLVENDMEIISMGEDQYDDQIDSQGDPKTHLGFSHKRKHISIDSTRPKKKHKCLSDLMFEDRFCIPNGENLSKRKAAGPKSISGSPAKKHKAIQNASSDHSHKSQSRKLFQLQCISMDEMLSKLYLAARHPFGETRKSVMLNFFSEFRNFIMPNDSASLEQGISSEQMHAEDTGVSSMEAGVSVTSAMETSNDLNWTDRTVESVPEDNSLLKNQKERDEFLPIDRVSPSFMPQETAEERLDGSSEKDSCAALILKFADLDSIPSKTSLNKIFGRFGPLIESQTELLKKSNRARVVFKRRVDAETAFSSAGKYSTFGPSLSSYSLKIMPSGCEGKQKVL